MKSIEDLKKDFEKKAKEYKAFENAKTRIAGNIAKKEISRNFESQGYDNGFALWKWKKRKASTDAAYYKRGKNIKGRVFSSKNPILVQTGNLKDSVRYRTVGKSTVLVGVNDKTVPYAKAHNEGAGKLPKRQYMPINKVSLNIIRAIAKEFNKRIHKIMK